MQKFTQNQKLHYDNLVGQHKKILIGPNVKISLLVLGNIRNNILLDIFYICLHNLFAKLVHEFFRTYNCPVEFPNPFLQVPERERNTIANIPLKVKRVTPLPDC